MKNIRCFLLGVILISGIQTALNAQIDNINFLRGSMDDAKLLFPKYLAPYANILGADLNAGWYNSAKPHKLGGFDLTITANTAWAPPADREFDLNGLTLSSEATKVPGDNGLISPTIAGKLNTTTPKIEYNKDFGGGNIVNYATFNLPKGTGVNMIPLPMAQLTIGLPWGTDVSVRYLPTLPLGKAGNIGLWGVGGRHSIIQHIPALKKLPIIDITAQGGYTKLTTSANLNIDPSTLSATDQTGNSAQWADQKLEMVASAWTVNLIFSETLPVISFYQGIGVSNSAINLGLKGNYPIPVPTVTGAVVVNEASVDPIDVEMSNNMDLRLNAGLRLKLGILTIQFDYTKANYSVFTTGLGISFR